AIVCPGIDDASAAVAVAERVRTAIAETIRVAGRDLEVTVSIGVATTRTSSSDPERLLQQADEALYQSKRRGRDRWELYEEALQRQAVERLTVQTEVRRALSDGWFRLHYQPVVDLTHGRMVGVEALLRMEHPERGII